MRIQGIVSTWLKNFPQLKYISADGFEAVTKDLQVFEHLTNLEELEINCPKSENIDFLKNCIKLKKLVLDLTYENISTSKVENIEALKYLTSLKELSITVAKNDGNNVLSNLSSSFSLEKLDLNSEDKFNIKLNTSNFYGLNKFDKLKSLTLDGTIIKF